MNLIFHEPFGSKSPRADALLLGARTLKLSLSDNRAQDGRRLGSEVRADRFLLSSTWSSLFWKPDQRQSHECHVTKIAHCIAPDVRPVFCSVILFSRGKTAYIFLQLLGAGCLVIVVLTHVSEALNLLPWMHWGLENSVGHYLDLSTAVLGFTLFPVGYLFQALTNR